MLRRGKVGRREGGWDGERRGVEPFIHVICRLYGQTTSVTCFSVSLWGRKKGVNSGAPGVDGGWREGQEGVKG